MSRFGADAETQDETTDANLHIARSESERSGGGDSVVTVAVHPSDVDERDNAYHLLAGVDHPARSADE